MMVACMHSENAYSTMRGKKMAEVETNVEMEEVTVKVPKPIMDYLRKRYGNAIKWLQYELVAVVKADVDSV